MHIFAHMDQNLPLSDLVGYGAVEWIDNNDFNKIHLCRFNGGELSVYGIGSLDAPDGVVWSSSFRHLLKSLYSAGFKTEQFFRYEIRSGKVYYIEDGALYYIPGKKLEIAKPPVPEEVDPIIKFNDVISATTMPELGGRNIDDFRTFNHIYGDFETWNRMYGEKVAEAIVRGL